MFRRDKPRELTGRHVLMWLVAFFGFIFVVNAVMIRAATSTFGGVETRSSYKAGLMFKSELERAERQHDLHWRSMASSTATLKEKRCSISACVTRKERRSPA